MNIDLNDERLPIISRSENNNSRDDRFQFESQLPAVFTPEVGRKRLETKHWDRFSEAQWGFLAPIFDANDPRTLMIDACAYLPITSWTGISAQGHFGTVYKVEMHPSHFRNFPWVGSSSRDQFPRPSDTHHPILVRQKICHRGPQGTPDSGRIRACLPSRGRDYA
jgi:hypothetical protein